MVKLPVVLGHLYKLVKVVKRNNGIFRIARHIDHLFEIEKSGLSKHIAGFKYFASVNKAWRKHIIWHMTLENSRARCWHLFDLFRCHGML